MRDLGVAFDSDTHLAPRPSGSSKISLEWRASHAALACFENLRQGGPPRFRLDLSGEVFVCDVDSRSQSPIGAPRGMSEAWSGPLWIEYPHDVWADWLRELGAGTHVFFEATVPPPVTLQGKEIVAALEEAETTLRRGGHGAWRSVGVAARNALDHWRATDPPAFGNEWNPPSASALRASWTKEHRANAIRYWLHQLCHMAAHEDFTRDEALLATNALAALLALRAGSGGGIAEVP